ncbi:hypothetical protein D9M68_945380 [compost metagenome]
MSTSEVRPPVPPFTRETAIRKVRLAEDGWNSRDAAKVASEKPSAMLRMGFVPQPILRI